MPSMHAIVSAITSFRSFIDALLCSVGYGYCGINFPLRGITESCVVDGLNSSSPCLSEGILGGVVML